MDRFIQELALLFLAVSLRFMWIGVGRYSWRVGENFPVYGVGIYSSSVDRFWYLRYISRKCGRLSRSIGGSSLARVVNSPLCRLNALAPNALRKSDPNVVFSRGVTFARYPAALLSFIELKSN
jgi:hypothetical protein